MAYTPSVLGTTALESGRQVPLDEVWYVWLYNKHVVCCCTWATCKYAMQSIYNMQHRAMVVLQAQHSWQLSQHSLAMHNMLLLLIVAVKLLPLPTLRASCYALLVVFLPI